MALMVLMVIDNGGDDGVACNDDYGGDDDGDNVGEVMITCVVADIMMRMRKRIATSDNASRCSSCN